MALPSFEVLGITAGPGVLGPGERVPLSGHTTVGRAPDADLCLPGVEGLARRHFLVERRYERWWLLDLGSSLGTLHNGVRVSNVELGHLDVVAVGGLCLRFLLRDEPDLREPAMEAGLVAAPDDEARWAVYADWLQERGSALGERLLRPLPEHHGRWLGQLAPAWVAGALEVDFHHGLPSRLVLRRLNDELRLLPNPLPVVARDPAFRFLRSLEVDVEAWVRRGDWAPALRELVRPLAGAALPLLGVVRVGPLSAAPPELDLAPTRVAFFRWPADPVLEVLSTPARVTLSPGPGGQVPLTDELLVGKLPSCPLRVEAPDGHPAALLAVRFVRHDGGWSVEDLFAQSRPFRRLEFALRVNGHEVVQARLRPGDVLELCSGLLVRVGPVG